MTDWTSGYRADIDYTFGYYPELNPARTRLALAHTGLRAPNFENSCELGFGQGLSIVFHSVGSSCAWYGTDFNPSQASFAKDLLADRDKASKLFDDSFEQLKSRTDLPSFDFIGLHGIWSWISDENRNFITRLIADNLSPGGVVYSSYNTMPGWSAFAPIRHLMTEHVEKLGSTGQGIVKSIDQSIEFTKSFFDVNPVYKLANPSISDRLEKLSNHDRQYLAHEYFNRDWNPMHFAEIADWFEGAKLSFACSADFLDSVWAINLTKEQFNFLEQIPDPSYRQSVRDFMVNQQFRKDYWVKGVVSLNGVERSEILRETRVVLLKPVQDVSLKLNRGREINLNPDVYKPILEALKSHLPTSIGELEIELKDQNISISQIVEAVMILIGSGQADCARSEEEIEASKSDVSKLNKRITAKAVGDGKLRYLASPVTGGGYPIGRIQQLFLVEFKDGYTKADDLAVRVWGILERQGQKLVKEGAALETKDENLEELRSLAKEFLANQVDVLKGLQIDL